MYCGKDKGRNKKWCSKSCQQLDVAICVQVEEHWVSLTEDERHQYVVWSAYDDATAKDRAWETTTQGKAYVESQRHRVDAEILAGRGQRGSSQS